MYLCLNSKDREGKYETVEVNGIYCRDTCPVPGFECEKEIG